MESKILRKKFLKYFQKKGHIIVPSSSLIPKDDPTVLLTTAGMQQFKPYFTTEKDPQKDFGAKRCASVQKCFRTKDIDDVGDESHLTFFEMLGNFSFGDYFKKEAIMWAYEFIAKELKLSIDYVTVFEGDENIPQDTGSIKFWNELGVDKIYKRKKEDNFWGPTGEEGPCGPTTEIYVNNIEIWNIVFNQFYQHKDKTLVPLAQNGVDTGMGLERLAMVVQNKESVFDSDLFERIFLVLGKSGALPKRDSRIIADHIRGGVFLISDGITPSNLAQGYILRRILRRIICILKLYRLSSQLITDLAQAVIDEYKDVYPEIIAKQNEIITVIANEQERFNRTLDQGLKEFKKLLQKTHLQKLTGKEVFHLYDTFGFTLDITKELAKKEGLTVDEISFKKEFKKHQEISRAGAKKKFGGIGNKAGVKEIRYHTATHLLHQALRAILGNHVEQRGSDISSERLRFDFAHPQKLSEDEKKKIEDLVNEKIKAGLDVRMEEMTPEEAIKQGALGLFREKYGKKVKMYSINNFSKEICAGPHVKNTKELGKFQIIKEQAVGRGVRRIKAILFSDS